MARKEFPPLGGKSPPRRVAVYGGPAVVLSPEQATIRQGFREAPAVLVAGEAGTGKTLLAAALALEELEAGRVNKIFACRPAVEAAGEKLGYLPGDGSAKVYPYLLPLHEAFKDLGAKPDELVRDGTLEIAPLAYLRGRTLRGVVILDEAQNCTAAQLRLFLTRLARGARVVVTGDPDQADLAHPPGQNPFGRLVQRVMDCKGKPPGHRVRAYLVTRGAQQRDPIVNDFLDLMGDL